MSKKPVFHAGAGSHIPVYGEEEPFSDADRLARYHWEHDLAGLQAGITAWHQLRLVQLKCSRCPKDAIGAIFECRHPDGSTHDIAEVQRLLEVGQFQQFRVMLDREPPEAQVLIDCGNRSHGTHVGSVRELQRLAIEGRRGIARRQREGHAGKSLVARLHVAQRYPDSVQP